MMYAWMEKTKRLRRKMKLKDCKSRRGQEECRNGGRMFAKEGER